MLWWAMPTLQKNYQLSTINYPLSTIHYQLLFFLEVFQQPGKINTRNQTYYSSTSENYN